MKVPMKVPGIHMDEGADEGAGYSPLLCSSPLIFPNDVTGFPGDYD